MDLGAGGRIPGNIYRDLRTAFKLRNDLPQPLLIDLPILNKQKQVEWTKWPVLPCDQLWCSLASQYPADFDLMTSGASEFWSGVRNDDPKLHGHPVLDQGPGWQSKFTPLRVHADAGQFTKAGNSIMMLDWGSILHVSHTLDSLFLFGCVLEVVICKQKERGVDTLDIMWKYYVHALNALLSPLQIHSGSRGQSRQRLLPWRARRSRRRIVPRCGY